MRDPSRIGPVLEAIREHREQNPDLRLGQLLINALRPGRPCPEVYFAEDDHVLAGLAGAAPNPPAAPGRVTLSLTTDEALVLLGLVLHYEATGRLPVPDTVEAELLSDLGGWLASSLGPVTDWTAIVASAKAALTRL